MKLNKKTWLVVPVLMLMICSVGILLSCSNDGPSAKSVYVAGSYTDANRDHHAAYWKDGKLAWSDASRSDAKAITTRGSDIYVVGSQYSATNERKVGYWVNDNAFKDCASASGITDFNDVITVGDQVYACGTVGGTPQIWNLTSHSIPYTLTADANYNYFVTHMTVIGDDIYVMGSFFYRDGSTQHGTCYWVNGDRTDITNPTDGWSLQGVSKQNDAIVLFGNSRVNVLTGPDINRAYSVIGDESAAYFVEDNNVNSGIAEVFVNGEDVYVVGEIENDPIWWKNRVKETSLGKLPDGYSKSFANGITMDGSDIYICGNQTTNSVGNGLYWKNGTPIKLEGTTSTQANDIKVF